VQAFSLSLSLSLFFFFPDCPFAQTRCVWCCPDTSCFCPDTLLGLLPEFLELITYLDDNQVNPGGLLEFEKCNMRQVGRLFADLKKSIIDW